MNMEQIREVKKLSFYDDGNTNQYYATNTLFRTKIIDPNGHHDYEYKDKLGRVVLNRQQEELDAYNIYDYKSRLSKVIPPGTDIDDNDLIYSYLYDFRNNISEQKIPDIHPIKFRYDSRNLLTLSQDGNQSAMDQWLHNHYDDYGREIKSGLLSFPSGTPLGNQVYNFTELLNESFYDGGGNFPISGNIYNGKLREERHKVLGTSNDFVYKYYNYNSIGQNVEVRGDRNGFLNQENFERYFTYDYNDNILWNRINIPDISFYTSETDFEYDELGRMSESKHGIDFPGYSGSIRDKNSIKYTYNHKNELKSKDLDGLQMLNYDYNNQGWLTKINTSNLGGTNMDFDNCNSYPNPGSAGTPFTSNDLFYLELKYDNPISNLAGNVEKSGNISQALFRVRGRDRLATGYLYDQYDRLVSSDFRSNRC